MYTLKNQVKRIVDAMPDDVTVDDIIAELFFKLVSSVRK